ncbi:hypothetical protein B0H19DRAFT_1071051 [Mycena capillaripes]|nr:hypothetical protein B0H19DRAFT_1071051 [Mycena capillaripes]
MSPALIRYYSLLDCTLFGKVEATPTRSQKSFSPAPKPPPTKVALAQQARRRQERENRETRMDIDWFVFGRDFDTLDPHQPLKPASLAASATHTSHIPGNTFQELRQSSPGVGEYTFDSTSDAAYTKHQKRGAGPIHEVSNNKGSRRTRNAAGRRTSCTPVMLGSIDKDDAIFEIVTMKH